VSKCVVVKKGSYLDSESVRLIKPRLTVMTWN